MTGDWQDGRSEENRNYCRFRGLPNDFGNPFYQLSSTVHGSAMVALSLLCMLSEHEPSGSDSQAVTKDLVHDELGTTIRMNYPERLAARYHSPCLTKHASVSCHLLILHVVVLWCGPDRGTASLS